MTSRKFYGSHFHSLTTHAAEVYRIMSLRSIIPEQEERGFGDLRRISENTSNRKLSYIIDNAVMRFNAQQEEKQQGRFTYCSGVCNKSAGKATSSVTKQHNSRGLAEIKTITCSKPHGENCRLYGRPEMVDILD